MFQYSLIHVLFIKLHSIWILLTMVQVSCSGSSLRSWWQVTGVRISMNWVQWFNWYYYSGKVVIVSTVNCHQKLVTCNHHTQGLYIKVWRWVDSIPFLLISAFLRLHFGIYLYFEALCLKVSVCIIAMCSTCKIHVMRDWFNDSYW